MKSLDRALAHAQQLADSQGRPWWVIRRQTGLSLSPDVGDAVGYVELHKVLPRDRHD
jgi:hypothetical protein